MNKMNNKGFTLMEVLIVVAIIAVLVAIAIPVMTNQLEKAREATDAANIRSAYAEVSVEILLGNEAAPVREVDLKQKVAGWSAGSEIELPVPEAKITGTPKPGKKCIVTGDSATGEITLEYTE